MNSTPIDETHAENVEPDSAGSRTQAPGHVPAQSISEATSDPTRMGDNETLEDFTKRTAARLNRIGRDFERVFEPIRKHHLETEARVREELREKYPDGVGEEEENLVAMQMGLEVMRSHLFKHARLSGRGVQGGSE